MIDKNMEQELAQLRKENKRLRELLGRLVISCEHMDHRPGEYHSGPECPVMEKFADIIKEVR